MTSKPRQRKAVKKAAAPKRSSSKPPAAPSAEAAPIEAGNPRQRYFNNELSLLDFQERVLAEAFNRSNPLLERVKFIAIVGSNLDEFLMVRMAKLKRAIAAGRKGRSPDGRLPAETLRDVNTKILGIYGRMRECLINELIPELAKAGIVIVPPAELTEQDHRFLDRYFAEEVFPVLTPLAIGPGHPFPAIGQNLAFAIEMTTEAGGAIRAAESAVLQMPSNLKRFVELPGKEMPKRFVPLEEAIRPRLNLVFSGYRIERAHDFRLTRDSDLPIEDDEAEDLLSLVRLGLVHRRTGRSVNLRVDAAMPEAMVDDLRRRLGLAPEEVFRSNCLQHLKQLFELTALPGFDHLRNEPLPPQPHWRLPVGGNIFEVAGGGDRLLHHPYHAFEPVEEFVARAADDPSVLAIKQTLYRTTAESSIMASLVRAAENGKQVTALIELRARFDEENNIHWTRRLERAGAHVIYGLAGLKVHCKACLVIRREREGIRRYVHLATGNYNEKTARLYTDMGLLSGDDELCQDISALFNVITGYSQQPRWNLVEIAPTGMRRRLMRLIEREIELNSKASPGYIAAKINSLEDAGIIDALYRASQAGVKIDLMVRGLCCLRPGVKGLSETIRVASVIDRFLEHSRIIYFQNGGREEVYLSSADWRPRNLDRRIELMFPVRHAEGIAACKEAIACGLADTERGWLLGPDGAWRRVKAKRGQKKLRSQLELHRLAVERAAKPRATRESVFTPITEAPR